jgi:alpha-amylase
VTSLVFYFQVHQPYRLTHRRTILPEHAERVGLEELEARPLFDDEENERIMRRVADKCYLPMNAVLLDAIRAHNGAFRCSFSISGTALQQLEDWAPDALDSFVELAKTGHVEFLAETSMHSLAFLEDPAEWESQVRSHSRRIQEVFGTRPTTFRNTELIVTADVARRLDTMGFNMLMAEGAEALMGWRSPHHLWRPDGCNQLKLFARDYPFSDDIAFRFSNREWEAYPLLADTFVEWLHGVKDSAEAIGLFMDYETFGEHQWEDTGIFEFMRHLPDYVLGSDRFDFATPSQIAARCEVAGEISIPRPVSWADAERDLTAWLGNPMQREAQARLYALLPRARALAGSRPEALQNWRRLSTSDHVYYMCTKFMSDGDVHAYFSPYGGPHDAFVEFMDALKRFEASLSQPATKAAKVPPQKSPKKAPPAGK